MSRRSASLKAEIAALKEGKVRFGDVEHVVETPLERRRGEERDTRFFDACAMLLWAVVHGSAWACVVAWPEMARAPWVFPMGAILFASAVGMLRFLPVADCMDYLTDSRFLRLRLVFLERQMECAMADSETVQGEAEGITEADVNAAAFLILQRHYALQEPTTRSVCQNELGISQPLWNAVNKRLQEAEIKVSGRSFDDDATFASAWERWTKNHLRYNRTLEMGSRPKTSA